MSQHNPYVTVVPFLLDFSPNVVEIMYCLRAIVKRALPDATERVYPGWRLIVYREPHGKRVVYITDVEA